MPVINAFRCQETRARRDVSCQKAEKTALSAATIPPPLTLFLQYKTGTPSPHTTSEPLTAHHVLSAPWETKGNRRRARFLSPPTPTQKTGQNAHWTRHRRPSRWGSRTPRIDWRSRPDSIPIRRRGLVDLLPSDEQRLPSPAGILAETAACPPTHRPPLRPPHGVKAHQPIKQHALPQ